MDSTDIYKIFHQNGKENNFSASHGTFSKIDQILGNKPNIHRYKEILATACVLSGDHGINLEFNNNSTCRKPTNSCTMNSQLLNHLGIMVEIKKINVFLKFNKDKDTTYQNL